MSSLEPAGHVRPMRQLWGASRPVRWAVTLGALTGLVAAGAGSRIAMRLIALVDPSTNGAFTDAKATVGDTTAEGTMGLLVLGTIAGVMGGLVYLGLRRWLPVPPAWNGLAYSVLTLLTVGNVLADPGNVDFQIFQPVLLAVALAPFLYQRAGTGPPHGPVSPGAGVSPSAAGVPSGNCRPRSGLSRRSFRILGRSTGNDRRRGKLPKRGGRRQWLRGAYGRRPALK